MADLSTVQTLARAKTENTKQITLHMSKETKRTVRYDAAEGDDMAAVGSIYVKKFALQGDRPETIAVTLSW